MDMYTGFNNSNSEIETGIPAVSYHEVIRHLNPAVIPRVTAIANMGWCERAAYDISFFGVDSFPENNMGDIGTAIHRIIIKSILEIVQAIKQGKNNIRKHDAKQMFVSNAEQEIDANWKTYALAGIENPLPLIMQDLSIRADRLADKLTTDDEVSDYQKMVLRPEFTIRNKDIPLEGRLDLLKIKLTHPLDSGRYIKSHELASVEIDEIEIIQIKTGKAKPRTERSRMQADAEALLLMGTFDLKNPPRYTWQFADKDVPRKKFNFPRVYQAIEKYTQLWKGQLSPQITGYCSMCKLKGACLGWYFARADKLAEEEVVRRKAAFKLSKAIRDEIANTDRWKVYASFRDADERHSDGWAITDLKVDHIDLNNQELVLVGQQGSFGNFVDFSVGDFVTISDGNPNLGSNPTAVVANLDLRRPSVTIRSIRNDLYFLTYDSRQNSILTMDRFDFDKGLTTIRYLDSFFRQSPHADIILERAGRIFAKDYHDGDNNDSERIGDPTLFSSRR
jgi:CRISPR/Cas system-associated exonuclease Cas4 (RecB family)